MMLNTGERLAVIENDLKYLKDQADTTVHTLNDFISKADDKYATKLELSNLSNSVQENKDTLIYIVKTWGPIIIILAYILLDKFVI